MRAWLVAAAIAMVPLAGAAPAHAAPTCAEQPSVLQCDSDGDGIVDLVEEAICGSATCATGAEDADGNGIPDAEELTESLKTGGPAGPIQTDGPDALLIVNPDGTIAEVSLWPIAGSAALLVAALAAFVVVRTRSSLTTRHSPARNSTARHSTKELVR